MHRKHKPSTGKSSTLQWILTLVGVGVAILLALLRVAVWASRGVHGR
ncbi:hypothetical protein ACOBR2_05940 [Telmatobacter bradus]